MERFSDVTSKTDFVKKTNSILGDTNRTLDAKEKQEIRELTREKLHLLQEDVADSMTIDVHSDRTVSGFIGSFRNKNGVLDRSRIITECEKNSELYARIGLFLVGKRVIDSRAINGITENGASNLFDALGQYEKKIQEKREIATFTQTKEWIVLKTRCNGSFSQALDIIAKLPEEQQAKEIEKIKVRMDIYEALSASKENLYTTFSNKGPETRKLVEGVQKWIALPGNGFNPNAIISTYFSGWKDAGSASYNDEKQKMSIRDFIVGITGSTGLMMKLDGKIYIPHVQDDPKEGKVRRMEKLLASFEQKFPQKIFKEAIKEAYLHLSRGDFEKAALVMNAKLSEKGVREEFRGVKFQFSTDAKESAKTLRALENTEDSAMEFITALKEGAKDSIETELLLRLDSEKEKTFAKQEYRAIEKYEMTLATMRNRKDPHAQEFAKNRADIIRGMAETMSVLQITKEFITEKKKAGVNLGDTLETYNAMMGVYGCLGDGEKKVLGEVLIQAGILVLTSVATMGAGAVFGAIAQGARVAVAAGRGMALAEAGNVVVKTTDIAGAATKFGKYQRALAAGTDAYKVGSDAGLLMKGATTAAKLGSQALLQTELNSKFRDYLDEQGSSANFGNPHFLEEFKNNLIMFSAFSGTGHLLEKAPFLKKAAETIGNKEYQFIQKMPAIMAQEGALLANDVLTGYALQAIETGRYKMSSEEWMQMIGQSLAFRAGNKGLEKGVKFGANIFDRAFKRAPAEVQKEYERKIQEAEARSWVSREIVFKNAALENAPRLVEAEKILRENRGVNKTFDNLLNPDVFAAKLAELKQLKESGKMSHGEYREGQKELVIEQALQRGAEMFNAGEDILRANPYGDPKETAQKLRRYFQDKNIKLSVVQDKLIDALVPILHDTLDIKRKQLQEIFNTAGKKMPEKLEDIQKTLNEDTDLNFLIWQKNYLNCDKDLLKSAIAKIPEGELSQYNWNLDFVDKKIYLITGRVEIDLLSHPAAIIEKYFSQEWYWDSQSFANLNLADGVIRLSPYWHNAESIQHEYQHFLQHRFLDPARKRLHEILIDTWKNHEQASLRMGGTSRDNLSNKPISEEGKVWRSVQDEFASYVGTDDLRLYTTPYLSTKLRREWISSEEKEKIIGMFLSIRLLQKTVNNSAIVDIVRSSGDFQTAYSRLIKNFPDGGLPESARDLNTLLIKNIPTNWEKLIIMGVELSKSSDGNFYIKRDISDDIYVLKETDDQSIFKDIQKILDDWTLRDLKIKYISSWSWEGKISIKEGSVRVFINPKDGYYNLFIWEECISFSNTEALEKAYTAFWPDVKKLQKAAKIMDAEKWWNILIDGVSVWFLNGKYSISRSLWHWITLKTDLSSDIKYMPDKIDDLSWIENMKNLTKEGLKEFLGQFWITKGVISFNGMTIHKDMTYGIRSFPHGEDKLSKKYSSFEELFNSPEMQPWLKEQWII